MEPADLDSDSVDEEAIRKPLPVDIDGGVNEPSPQEEEEETNEGEMLNIPDLANLFETAEEPGPFEGPSAQENNVLPQGVLSEDDSRVFSQLIFESMLTVGADSSMSLPWEIGPFREIFGQGQSTPPLPTPKEGLSIHSLQHQVTDRDTQTSQSFEPIRTPFLRALKFKENENEAHELRWQRCLEKWYLIFCADISTRPPGLTLDHDGGSKDLDEIKFFLGNKSLATVEKRAGALIRYMKWHSEHSYEANAFPLNQAIVEAYFMHLHESEASASAFQAFEQICNFCTFHLRMRLSASSEGLISLRSRRLIDTAEGQRKERTQARPLTVEEVVRLEKLLQDSSLSDVDRYFSGVMLFCIYGRCRLSDVREVFGAVLDIAEGPQGVKGFLECRTRSHKTGRIVMRQGLAMPLVAPILGLSTPPWGCTFVDIARKVDHPFDHTLHGALLPAPNIKGSWMDRPVSSQESTKWLRLVLEPFKDGSIMPSTHSLKSTTLSWAAKYGLEPHDRLLLGHHSTGKGSLECYSRDVLASPLREYDRMLKAIRDGFFHPDNTRSGMISETPHPQQDQHAAPIKTEIATCEHEPGPGVAEPSKINLDDSSSDSSETTSTTSESSLSDAAIQRMHVSSASEDANLNMEPTFDPDFEMYQHKKTRVIHLRSVGSSKNKFNCGVGISAEFVAIHQSLFMDARKCKRCNLAKPIRDIGSFASALKKQRLTREAWSACWENCALAESCCAKYYSVEVFCLTAWLVPIIPFLLETHDLQQWYLFDHVLPRLSFINFK